MENVVARLSLSLLGPVASLLDDEALKFRSNRGQALLIYLVTEQMLGSGTHRRDSLMDLLWPGLPQKSAQVNLRQTLYQLRQSIPPAKVPVESEPVPLLRADRQSVGLNERYPITSDVETFTFLLEGPENGWPEALDLYQDDFLVDFFLPDANTFEAWAAGRRAAFRRQALRALDRLADMAIAGKDGQSAERYARRQLAIDDLHESAHRQLMQALALTGQRSQALSQYGEVERLLAAELGAEPSAETETLYRQLLSGEPLASFMSVEAEAERPPRVIGSCPYRGLAAFREDDAPFFFGREMLIGKLSEAVSQHTLAHVLVGSSGSGKSSVVYAGLLPRLRPDGNWLVATARPGSQPFQAMAASLVTLLEPGLREADRLIETQKLGKALADGELALESVARRALEKNGESSRLLLLLDQFEELYTLCPDETLRRRFLDELLAAVESSAQQRIPPLVFLLTLRADFMGQALSHRPFADVLQESALMIGPMTAEEIQQAIEKPAEKQGAAFEEGLVERILKDVARQPGQLPLLEFALTLLWEKQQDGWLSHADYEEIGQVEGALARYADNVMKELEEKEAKQARQIFVQLVRPGQGTEDTRRVATRSELGDDHWALVRHLADHRLVVTGRDEGSDQQTVEIIHEALIQRWGQLREWMTSDRAFRTWQERLRASLQGWKASGEDEGALLRGVPLAEAENWLDERAGHISAAEREFIEFSVAVRERRETEREARQQRELETAQKLAESEMARAEAESRRAQEQADTARRLRWLAAGLSLLMLVATGASLFAWQQSQETEQQTRLARSRELAAAALSNLPLDPERSILLALRAVETTLTVDQTIVPEAETVLHQAVSASHMLHALLGHRGVLGTSSWVTDVAFSPDGTRLVTASGDNTVKVWQVSSGEELLSINGDDSPFGFWGVAYSPDGMLIAAGSSNESVIVWDAHTGQKTHVLGGPAGHTSLVNRLTFSPDGQRLASTSLDGTTRIWDLAAHRVTEVFSGIDGKPILDVAFSPDGEQIATGGDNMIVTVRGARQQPIIELTGHVGGILGVAFSPDGTRVASGSSDGTARVWDLAEKREIHIFTGHSDAVWEVAFSPDGSRLATASADGTARIWDLVTGKQRLSLAGHIDMVLSVAISPDGTRLATASKDQTARIWDLAPDHELFAFESGVVYDMVVSSDGTRLATTSGRGTAKLWDLATGQALLTVSNAGHEAPLDRVEIHIEGSRLPAGVSLSPDGRYLAVGNDNRRTTIWDTLNGQAVRDLAGHSGAVNGVAFSPDGARLATTSEDTTAKMWDVASGEELLTFKGHQEWVWRVFFSPDGSQIVTTSPDDRAIVWDSDTGEPVRTLLGHTDKVSYAAFSPDGAFLSTVSGDGSARIWNLATGVSQTLSGHTSAINGVAYSAAGDRLATASADGTIRVWDSATGDELIVLSTFPTGVGNVVFSQDGTQLISANWDNTVRTSTLSIELLMQLARQRLTRELTEEECRRYLHLDACPASGD